VRYPSLNNLYGKPWYFDSTGELSFMRGDDLIHINMGDGAQLSEALGAE
jgi:hypothetical protein